MSTPKTQAQQKQLEELKDSINLMDQFAHDGFERIQAIARLALLAMETPEGHRHMETYATAFDAIFATACDFSNLVNYEAGKSGDHYSDPAWRRRADARRGLVE